MSNLSYCRFENTFEDLRDCYEALLNGVLDEPDFSERERSFALALIDLCGNIFDDFSDEAEEDEDE